MESLDARQVNKDKTFWRNVQCTSSRILAVKIEVAGRTETWVCVYQVTWRLRRLWSRRIWFLLVLVRCALLPRRSLCSKPPSSSDIPSPHTCQVAPCRRLEFHLLLHHTVLASLSCSLSALINSVSTKDTKQANLFRVPAARLCVGVDQWVFCLLAEWSCCCPASSLSVAQGRRQYG